MSVDAKPLLLELNARSYVMASLVSYLEGVQDAAA